MAELLTHGGLPASGAKHWCEQTYQALGQALYELFSSVPAVRSDGYNRFYRLKREFMPDEWDEYLGRLEKHRSSLGAKPIMVILEEVRSQLVRDGHPSPSSAAEPGPVKLPESATPAAPAPEKSKSSVKPVFEAEQLSLF